MTGRRRLDGFQVQRVSKWQHEQAARLCCSAVCMYGWKPADEDASMRRHTGSGAVATAGLVSSDN